VGCQGSRRRWRQVSNAFFYSNPGSIFWGDGSLSRLAGQLEQREASRVVLVTTSHVADDHEVMDRVTAALPYPPAAICLIGQHAPVADVEAAVGARHEVDADAIVSLGGGSPIDAAKIVARGATDARQAAAVVPHIAVPTTLSVAEHSSRAGFTGTGGDKTGFAEQDMLPTAVIYEPRLAVRTPMTLWLSTGIRALDHAVEGLMAAGEHPFSDVLSLRSIELLFEALPRTKVAGSDLAARSDCQVAAWFSYTLPAESMTGLGHQMGKQIGARHGIPHGVTSCLLLPHATRYLAARDPERAAHIDEALTGRFGGNAPAADRIYELIGSLGLPQHLAEFGLGAAELRRAADELGGKVPADDIYQIYLASL
jgi:maleylacetate reductase